MIGYCNKPYDVLLHHCCPIFRLERTMFVLPEVDGNGTVLDSVVMVRDDLLAAKCALHGQIYIFSLKEAIKKRTASKYDQIFLKGEEV